MCTRTNCTNIFLAHCTYIYAYLHNLQADLIAVLEVGLLAGCLPVGLAGCSCAPEFMHASFSFQEAALSFALLL